MFKNQAPENLRLFIRCLQPGLVNHAFSLVRGLFCINHTGGRKKVLENKSLELVGFYFRRLFNTRTFTFLIQGLPQDFFQETFFQGLFWRLPN